jgi:hypothetical protein
MRLPIVLFAALALGTVEASASPLGAAAGSAAPPNPLAIEIHHKPGHQGGPPWTRGRQHQMESFGDDRVYEARPRYRREVCRTSYRTVFDRYTGEYVRRPVQICSTDD